MNEIINYISNPQTHDFKCYDTLKTLLQENKQFREIIIKGIEENKITGFPDELWEKLDKQNIRSNKIESFVDAFKEGANQGSCTPFSKQVSYSLNTCYICGGELPILKGTKNCEEGNHTWIEYRGKIIDTTLMMIIDLSYKNQIGYIEETRCNPNCDRIYSNAKDYTNDSQLRRKKI